MARDQISGEACFRCSSLIERDQKLCNYCGKPTQNMTFVELNEYEVAQYRAWREKTTASA